MEIKATFLSNFCVGLTVLVNSVPRPRNDIHTLSRSSLFLQKRIITPGKAIKHGLLELQLTGQVGSELAELKGGGGTKVGLETIM